MSIILKRNLSLVMVLLLTGLMVWAPSCKKSEPGIDAEAEKAFRDSTAESPDEVEPGQSDEDQSEQDSARSAQEDALKKLQQLEAELEKKQADQQARQKAQEETVKKAEENIEPKTEGPGEKLVPLEIELPRPMFVGTPPNTKIDRVEKPLGKPRPLLSVPEGTINVSKGKPVTSSDDNPIIGTMDQITDGDNEGIDGNWVELMFGTQWVQIDLQNSFEIYAIVFWHFHMQPLVFRDVVVQLSDDPDFVNATTLFNNDYDNSSGLGKGEDLHYVETSEGKLVEGKGLKARYVRLYSNGNTENDSNQYIEVEVYGKPIK